MTMEPLVLPRAVDPLVPRSVRVLLALTLGAVSTVVVLVAASFLSWPGQNEGILLVPLVLGAVGCSVSVRLAVRTSLRP